MQLRLANYHNFWTVNLYHITLLRFYTKERGLVAESDFGYLPDSNSKFAVGAPFSVKQIYAVTKRRSENTGMRHGGHFNIGPVLYLDLNEFAYWEVQEQKVYDGPGYETYARGILIQYDVCRKPDTDFENVQRFIWHRERTEQRDTPLKKQIEAVQAWFNKEIADHPNRYLSDAAAARILAKRAELIAILDGL